MSHVHVCVCVCVCALEKGMDQVLTRLSDLGGNGSHQH